jgi:hypothetical protein
VLISFKTVREGDHIKELQDYSGQYKPDAKFADFSKDTLVKLLESYQNNLCGINGNVEHRKQAKNKC